MEKRPPPFRIVLDDVAMLPISGGEASERLRPSHMQTMGVREHVPGDPLRATHWGRTFATSRRHVRIAEKPRMPSVRIVVDYSASSDIEYAGVSKQMVMRNLVSLLGVSAVFSGAELQGITISGQTPFFSKSVTSPEDWYAECTTLFRHGMRHRSGETELGRSFSNLTDGLRGVRSLVVVVSDFVLPVAKWMRDLRSLSAEHSVVLLVVRAPLDTEIPYGLWDIRGAETGHRFVGAYDSKSWITEVDEGLSALMKAGVGLEWFNLRDDPDPVSKLVAFWKKRNAKIQ
jgi:uncharacterized protein (DUF58 family)